MNKEIKRIFITLALYSLSGGIFYSFQELWMADNNLSTKTISIIFSLCALIAVSVIFLCSNIVKQEKIKKLTLTLLLTKSIILFLLFILNKTGLNILIKFLILIEFSCDVEIYASIYPMMSIIKKGDKLYALRGLVYDSMYYIGVLVASILLGKIIYSISIDYNLYCLLSAITMFLAFIVLYNTDLEKYYNKINTKNDNNLISKLIEKIKKDKISKNYLLFVFFGEISYYIILGLLLTLLTKYIGLTPKYAANFNLMFGILAVVVGAIILSKLTLKNNYINLSIKFIGRLITYVTAAIIGNNIAILIAIIYTKITSDSYAHITDAPYINRIDTKYQLAFNNIKSMIGYLSRAIGTFICGLVIVINVNLIFYLAAFFIIIQIYFAFRALYLLNRE